MKLFELLFFFFMHILKSIEENCTNLDSKYNCPNNRDFNILDSWDERGFQTPLRNDIYWKYLSTYQDMHYFVGYAQLKYSSDKKKCKVTFISKVNPKLGVEGKDYYILYHFGEMFKKTIQLY